MPNFFGEVTQETRAKDKERVKFSIKSWIELKLKERSRSSQKSKLLVPQQVYDQKLSVVNFLANVIAEAEVFGINYSTIF